ncbi:MAG: alpha/beta fold hydrolase [Gammaproteobacteria bacterium]|nr:alpha/beta fold hydrolase [Gammaproteobacteria bacterium]MDH3414694.1 alpha/beta fold hydrolase [Gammaproteobacteria bacterium]
MRTPILTALFFLLVLPAAADAERRVANNGNLVMEDVPEIPADIVDSLNQYQNVRSASFQAWSGDGESLLINTRFGDVGQLHRVDMPMGARHQVTFYNEPVGEVSRQPGGSKLIFTRDVGGSEFSQIFLLDPAGGDAQMITDGESRNGTVLWDREGHRLAYQSTRRNGASNDIWLADPENPADTKVVLESPDGSWWGPTEFSQTGTRMLVTNYVSITDSRVNLLDLDTGNVTLLAGDAANPSVNVPLAFDDDNDGFWFITDRAGEFSVLAWQSLEEGAEPEYISSDIPWNVDGGAISHDRRRAAFTVNENGRTAVYLFDPHTREYRRIDSIPVGLVGGLEFSPDDSRLAMTINTASSPSDTHVLELGRSALDYSELVRWTQSEVGGLDTTTFIEPALVEFPTFDEVGSAPRKIPAWIYRPRGSGPFPVVVSIHGGPESQARPAFASTYQLWLDKLGVAVVVPNVRGSAGYGKTYVSLDNGLKREDSVKDIGALLDWIETQPDLDQDRVAVFGGSYGGYMVLASAVHFSDRLKAAVDIVGISSFVTFLENTQDYRRDLRRVEYGDERDPEMRAHLEKISPVNNVEKIHIPLFIVQGENDPRVPVTESIQMVAALRDRGETVWYMNALNEGHGYRKKENRDIYQQATVLFLKVNLLGE